MTIFKECGNKLKESDYELRYKLPTIDCDAVEIRLVYNRKEADHTNKEAARLWQILENELGEEYLQKILDCDEEASSRMFLEKIARRAAAEMCVNGKYDVETFTTMASLPLSDFKLVTKRVMELVSIANDVSNQAMNVGIAGL